MVFIKVSLGQELRKFTTDRSTSLESVKATIKQLFPALNEVAVENIHVFYRDSDNDLIAVSSDEELHTALSELGDNDTLRVILRITAAPPEKEETEEDEREEPLDLFGDLFHSLFGNPFHHGPMSHPFDHHGPTLHSHLFHPHHGPSWLGRQHALKLHEEKIRQQRVYEEKMRKARLEQMAAMREKALKEQEEMKKKLREERRKSTELQRQASDQGNPLMPQFPPGWQVNSFGSWDPVLQEGPSYSRKSWGPFGYVAYYNPQEEAEKQEEKEETAEETPEETPEGGEQKTAEEGMESTST